MYLTLMGLISVGWVNLVQDRDQWCAFVRTVMKIRVL
jgi:hypothetical protein